MRYVLDHDLHIHSQLSSCSSDPAQTTERILQYGVENGFKKVCIADHYWDSAVDGVSDWYRPQNFDHIKQALPLPQSDSCKFLFGCETEMDRFFKIGIPKERFDDFDFIVIPTTHLHMGGFTYLPEEDNAVDKARLYVERLDALLDMDLPFHKIGIAHLSACLMLLPDERAHVKILDLIDDDTYRRLFKKCAQVGCGIELNINWWQLDDPELEPSVMRPYFIAKECGCKFYMGSDAHHPNELDGAMRRFERIVDILDLKESDKFDFCF